MSKPTITREDLERWANCTAATPAPISSDMWLARVVAFSEAKENSPKLARLVLELLAYKDRQDAEVKLLREALYRYGDKISMANAPAHLQEVIDQAMEEFARFNFYSS